MAIKSCGVAPSAFSTRAKSATVKVCSTLCTDIAVSAGSGIDRGFNDLRIASTGSSDSLGGGPIFAAVAGDEAGTRTTFGLIVRFPCAIWTDEIRKNSLCTSVRPITWHRLFT